MDVRKQAWKHESKAGRETKGINRGRVWPAFHYAFWISTVGISALKKPVQQG